jgi:excisionase family DNA binding protein
VRTPQDPDIYTTAELAAVLGHSPQTLQRWARAGLIPAMRAGKDYRFCLSRVCAALEEQHRQRHATTQRTRTTEPDLDAIPARRRARRPAPRPH